MTQTTIQLLSTPTALQMPHIRLADFKEVNLAGKTLHVFVISSSALEGNNPMKMLQNLFLRASEVVEGFPSQAVQSFLRDSRHHREESRVPDFVWLDSDSCDVQAITPISLADALGFWSARAFCGDPWAKRITSVGVEVEATVLGEFGWGVDTLDDQSLAWLSSEYSELADGGLRVRETAVAG